MTRRILVSPNAFKGSLSALEATETISSSLNKLGLVAKKAPIADGGDGTIEVIKYYFKSAKYITGTVHDPLMRKIKSKWLLLNKNTAVIELSKVSGISLLNKNELNPLQTTTFGTGELILSALNKGCKEIIITLGGSATVDAGMGILSALGVRFLDEKNKTLRSCGKSLRLIRKIDLANLDKKILKCKIIVLCDVEIPLTGKIGTVMCFSGQKGANKNEKLYLERGMKNLVKIIKKMRKKDFHMIPMVGSAGGVAFGLKTFLNANLCRGFDYVSRLSSLEKKIKKSGLIITGEGYLDKQTLLGKGIYKLAMLAKAHKKKVIVFCGNYDKSIDWKRYNICHIVKIKPVNYSLSQSLRKARILLQNAVKANISLFSEC